MTKYKNDPTDYWRVSSDYCVVDNRTAVKIGLNEAIVLRTLYELCRTKKQNDGISWWQGKREYWLVKFPWLSESALKRFLAKLEKMKLIEIRVNRQTGNHYRPVEDQIQRMLNDDYFCIEQTDLTYDITSGQIEPTSGQIEPTSGQIEPTSGQIEPTLLSLGSSPLSAPLSHVPTASAVEVLEAEKTIDKPHKAFKEQTGGSLIFEAFAEAYFNRYGFEPARGKEANRWAKKIYEEVGTLEGRDLVCHYVSMNKQWFLQKGHSLEWCFRDLTEVKRSFVTGKTMTTAQIKQLEQRQTAKEVSDEVQQSNGELASAWARIDTKRTIKI